MAVLAPWTAVQATTVQATFLFGPANVPASSLMTCLQAEAQSVVVTVDAELPQVFDCDDMPAAIDMVPGFSHTFALTAWSEMNGAGILLYANPSAIVDVPRGGLAQVFVLSGRVNGGLHVSWTINQQSCALSGAATVVYSLVGPLGNEVSPPQTVVCDQDSFQYALSPGLTPGVYLIPLITAQDSFGNARFAARNTIVWVPAGQESQFVVNLSPDIGGQPGGPDAGNAAPDAGMPDAG